MIGRTLGNYRIDEIIGDGGMARVYRGTHTFLEQSCAIKVLFGELSSDEAFTSRFRREALAASKIKHDNVVSILDFGETETNLPFMVMEFVRGTPLSAALHGDQPLKSQRISRITKQIAEGLAEAHRLGFVHRDLKPGNVMLTQTDDGEVVKILDFGLVHLSHGSDSEPSQLTRQGQILGTPTYMAPEQISAEEVTPKTDLYALGVIVYEMLTGKPPFAGELTQVLTQHVTSEPATPPSAEGLGPLAMMLLAKAPDRRPKDAEAVVALLAEIDRRLRGSIVEIPAIDPKLKESMPIELPEGARPVGPRVMVAGLLAALLVGGGWFWWVSQGEAPAVEAIDAPEPPPSEKVATETPKKKTRKKRKRKASKKATTKKRATATKPSAPTAEKKTPVATTPAEPVAEPTPETAAKAPAPKEPPPATEPAKASPKKTKPTLAKPTGAAREKLTVTKKPSAPASEAKSDATTVTVTGPDGKPVKLNDSDVAELKKRLEQTEQAKKKRLNTTEAKTTRHRRAAMRALARKDLGTAEAEATRCLKLDPKAADCHKLLAMVHERRGNKAGAIAGYKRYLELAPKAADAKSIAKIIEQLSAT